VAFQVQIPIFSIANLSSMQAFISSPANGLTIDRFVIHKSASNDGWVVFIFENFG